MPQPLCDAAPRKVPLSQKLYISVIWLTYAVAKIAPNTKSPSRVFPTLNIKGNFDDP
ncbi:hypothetical protein PXNS11_160015 [Stutzerimonas xanthomarina]|nr:hypothetical protein PXNS11_160015 [Stutzerimonas xanthomarina]